MVWCAGWKLAAAVSNAGGLGLIGSGSMHPEVLLEHIRKCQNGTSNPFGVNVPLMIPEIDRIMQIIIKEGVKIVFTSAGDPKQWTKVLKDQGIIVVHVVGSAKFALKAQAAGADAVVAEGFEAGGHNGREETTTFCLIPLVRQTLSLPLLAAGGIATGRGMLAALALGAEGVQIGTRFAISEESSAHANFKKKIVEISEGETMLCLKKLVPVRMVKNEFYERLHTAEERGASKEELEILLGKGRAKRGIFEGDLAEGELEIGQVSAQIRESKPAQRIVDEIWEEFLTAKKDIGQLE